MAKYKLIGFIETPQGTEEGVQITLTYSEFDEVGRALARAQIGGFRDKLAAARTVQMMYDIKKEIKNKQQEKL